MSKKILKVQMRDINKHPDGKEPKNHSPAFDYCRKLIKEGFNPNTRLEIYRNDMLCLTIPEIKEGAKWSILENRDKGPRFKEYEPFPADRIAGKGFGSKR